MASDSDILANVARALNGSVDVNEALDVVLTKVAQHLGLETGWVWVADHELTFRLGAARRLPEGLRRSDDWTTGSCWCQRRFCEGGLAGGEVELITCSRLDQLQSGTDGLRYHASLALEAGGERLGILNLASRDWRELTSAELQLLRAVSDMLSVALGRARLYERASELGAIEERARLSREMHDGVAQTLTALVLRLEALSASTEAADLTHAVTLARTALEDTREAMMELRASPFGDRLGAGVKRAIRRITTRTELAVDLELSIDAEPPHRVIHATCRILQESLTNIVRHTSAERCSVAIRATGTSLRMSVSDDGPGCTSDGTGLGILGMRERARLIGATFHFDSTTSGTRIHLEWEAT